MKEEKWLLRKASGARAKLKWGGDYSADKTTGLNLMDDLPLHQPVKKATIRYLDSSLIKKWLHNYINQDFDYVYSEYLKRIQPKYLHDYRNEIFVYVEPKSEITIDENGILFGKRLGKTVQLPYFNQKAFYVHPQTNLLMSFSS